MALRLHAAVSGLTIYTGMCDASAAVALDAEHFAVANDEDNPIRIFQAQSGGPALAASDFSHFLRIDPKKPELDLEGATWLGDRIFWITSHGRNRSGKFRSNRNYFFATEVRKTGGRLQLVPVGRPYKGLLSELLRDPRLRPFGLDLASQLAPKTKDALNIEGLCQTPQGHLLIGFRNPIPDGQALLVPLLNPNEVVSGKAARLGPPILLDLGGLGVRDIALISRAERELRNAEATSSPGLSPPQSTLRTPHYLIVAGSYDGRGRSVLYRWSGEDRRPEKLDARLDDFNPEAIVVYPDGREQFQLLSDDGTRVVGGVSCKHLRDPRQRSFRSIWVSPEPGN